MAQTEQQSPDTANEQGQNSNEQNGNFFSRYGKIFLIAVVLLVQGGIAYGVVNAYYDKIYKWAGQLGSDNSIYHTFENIIVNPAESGGERYLILSIVVEVGSAGDADRLDNKGAKIIDKVNLILTRRTARQLADLQERENIKQEIGIVINDILGKKAVRNLFFTKYVLQ